MTVTVTRAAPATIRRGEKVGKGVEFSNRLFESSVFFLRTTAIYACTFAALRLRVCVCVSHSVPMRRVLGKEAGFSPIFSLLLNELRSENTKLALLPAGTPLVHRISEYFKHKSLHNHTNERKVAIALTTNEAWHRLFSHLWSHSPLTLNSISKDNLAIFENLLILIMKFAIFAAAMLAVGVTYADEPEK